MSTVKNFEDLQAWQRARVLAAYVYELTRKGEFSRDWALRNQIRDAAGSVMHDMPKALKQAMTPNFPVF